MKTKPSKPRADFPLFAHANGQWAKKIGGRIYYFGKWDDSKHAESRYLYEAPYIRAGRSVPVEGIELGVHVGDLCNLYLEEREKKLATGEITNKTWDNYKRNCAVLIEGAGRTTVIQDMAPREFSELRSWMAIGQNMKSLDNRIAAARSVFKFGVDMGCLESLPRYGQSFARVTKKKLREQRQHNQKVNGKRMFEASEILTMVAEASPQLAAIILLGINGALGNTDCSSFDWSMVNWKTGWVDYPRPKTSAERKFKLWPETKEALRPFRKPGQNSGRVFSTRNGHALVRTTTGGTPDDSITKLFKRLLDRLDIYRFGLGCYALRHTFETIGGSSGDQVAVDFIMGHLDDSMAALYRENVFQDRLVKVTDHVHSWLFGFPETGK